MILIADSGSTKTDWRVIDEKGNISKFQTIGLNPFFIDAKNINKIINNTFCVKLNIEKVKKIFFYGAGCVSISNCNTIKDSFVSFFKNADVFVFTDLFGAARALYGSENGIVVILGTGMNTACFDGEKITKNISSLGYILGDEGSGAYLGKIFIADFLNNELPDNIANKFSKEYELTKENILEAIYSKPFPNRFLASFTKFLFENKNNGYVIGLLSRNFNVFFDKTICKYE
ncbi:MAG: N-acetylglucosamine kinase, partial [Bacteroidetes bacterium]|nr:N-acetylglucosamine kinase [Bacteroidota bacterium]